MHFLNKMTIGVIFTVLACGAASAASWPLAQREALDACVARAAGELHFNGSVYLALPGDPVVAKHFGTSDADGKVPITSSTRFNIGSAGKMLTAVSIGMLAERGALQLDDPIGRYLPGLDPQAATITIQQLLLHTSGLGDYFQPANMRAIEAAMTATDLLPLALATPPAFPPGSKVAYSNSGFVVLGAIIERLSDLTYAEFVQKEILTPLGMASTSPTAERGAEAMTRMSLSGGMLDRPQPSPMRPAFASPAGGMFSTLLDMSRFLTALANHRLVRAETLAALFRPRAKPPARVGHNGGAPGVNAEIWFYPDSGWQLIALSNYDPPTASRIAGILEQAMLAPDPGAACDAALTTPPPQMPIRPAQQ